MTTQHASTLAFVANHWGSVIISDPADQSLANEFKDPPGEVITVTKVVNEMPVEQSFVLILKDPCDSATIDPIYMEDSYYYTGMEGIDLIVNTIPAITHNQTNITCGTYDFIIEKIDSSLSLIDSD